MKQVIVMAAGLGSRLKDLTKDVPKPLLKINDKPLIETNIEFMINAGIGRVVIIIGYLKEQFYYLKEKYESQIDIEFVINDKYSKYNTIYSMYCARGYFDCDSYITTADNFLLQNLYAKYKDKRSFYLLRPYQHFEKEEWTVELNEDNRFADVNLHGHEGYSYSGVSFWTVKDLMFIKEKLEEVDWNKEETKKMYWDNVLLPYINSFSIYGKILDDNNDFYEIDDKSDLQVLSDFMKEKRC